MMSASPLNDRAPSGLLDYFRRDNRELTRAHPGNEMTFVGCADDRSA
jgi:hypothetical protein